MTKIQIIVSVLLFVFSDHLFASYCNTQNEINNNYLNCIKQTKNVRLCFVDYEKMTEDAKTKFIKSMQHHYSLTGHIDMYVEIFNCTMDSISIISWKKNDSYYLLTFSNNEKSEIAKDKMDILIYAYN